MATRDPADWGLPDLAPQLALGASPRATLGLFAAGRALAVLRGRRFLVPQDIFDVAPEVLRHRLMLTYDALADDVTADDVISQVLARCRRRASRRGRTTRPVRPPAPARPWLQEAARPRAPTRHADGVASRLAEAAQLRRLELVVTRRLDGLVSGEFLGLPAGSRQRARRHRPYEIGDDARRIDWNLTARSLTPQVRTTDADRELSTWIVVDRSASLDFGTAECEKRDLAFAAAAAFGFLTARARQPFRHPRRRRRRVTRIGPSTAARSS